MFMIVWYGLMMDFVKFGANRPIGGDLVAV